METATRGATPRRGPGAPRPADVALRRTATGLGLALGTGTLGLLGAAWHCATELLDPQRAGDPYTLRLVAVDGQSVTLAATPDTQEPGVCCLQWPGGYGLLGAEVRATPPALQQIDRFAEASRELRLEARRKRQVRTALEAESA